MEDYLLVSFIFGIESRLSVRRRGFDFPSLFSPSLGWGSFTFPFESGIFFARIEFKYFSMYLYILIFMFFLFLDGLRKRELDVLSFIARPFLLRLS